MAELLLVGATGMVGSAVVRAAPAGLHILVRRPAEALPAGVHQTVAPTEEWAEAIAKAAPDVVASALGTTIRQAGSQAAFRAVDHDLLLAVAKAARDAGARHFITVSSVGASARSASFYLRTKGEVEEALGAMGFERVDILRPGLLTGERRGPFRAGEAMAMIAAPLTDALMRGRMRRYRSVPGETVAQAILALAAGGGSGRHVHEHDGIVRLAG
ncbi:MAG: NAD(P)H-binding protein [Sphingopyxis sp.]|nr:NAD(P)H-binding protein [Sphingopyxis sp.]